MAVWKGKKGRRLKWRRVWLELEGKELCSAVHSGEADERLGMRGVQ